MYIFHAWDKENHLELRKANRDAHIKWLKSLGHIVKLAGPTLDENGQMNGSVLVLDMASYEECIHALAQDPYAKAELFEKTTLSPYIVAIEQF